MGTSSARLGPTGRLWRLAKGAATRYLSPESHGAVAAREVAARYVAALGAEGEPGLADVLAAFRLTRRAAQNLGAFCCQAGELGWPSALQAWGLTGLTGKDRETLAPALGVALGPAGGGLEQAVAHAALIGILLAWPGSPGGDGAPAGSAPPAEPALLVRRFLADACHRRLALDLGESLEAAAAAVAPLRQGLRELAACIDLAAAAPALQTSAPLTPEQWLGLPGWTWVTSLLEQLLIQLSKHGVP